MKPGHVAIIGFGAIAQDLISILKAATGGAPERISVLVREARRAETIATLADTEITVVSEVSDLLETNPEVVVECAGHSAVAAFGPRILEHGVDLIVASVGALANPEIADALKTATVRTQSQCVVPAGAIGGIDALGAAKLSGLKNVTYTGRKPPKAWQGTPADEVTELAAINKACVIFEGTARQAAQNFPRNANVAATLALAGMGMDATKVRLIADPTITKNVHEFSVASNALEFSVRLVGKPSPLNPKTSRSTVYSIARAVLNRRAAIVI